MRAAAAVRWALAALAPLALTGRIRAGGRHDFGKPGGPVKLVVGYQPYYTQSWSGVVMRGKKFYEKYLPEGLDRSSSRSACRARSSSTTCWPASSTSATWATCRLSCRRPRQRSRRHPHRRRTSASRFDQCNIFLARNDAPQFSTPKEAHQVARRQDGGGAEGQLHRPLRAGGVQEGRASSPKDYLNQNIEVITSNFRAGKIDAAVIWEPTASRLVQEGLARRVASGASVQENDGGFLAMRADLIKQRPDVVKAWLQCRARRPAVPRRPEERDGGDQDGEGADHRLLREDRCGPRSTARTRPRRAAAPVRNQLHYTFTPEARELIKRAAAFLHSIKSINVEQAAPGSGHARAGPSGAEGARTQGAGRQGEWRLRRTPRRRSRPRADSPLAERATGAPWIGAARSTTTAQDAEPSTLLRADDPVP